MDAKAYAAGERAGREGKAADKNPHIGDNFGTELVKALVVGPFAPMIIDHGDDEKANAWAEGHAAGSRNRK